MSNILILEKQNPQPIQINTSATANANATATTTIDFRVELPQLQNDFFNLRQELEKGLSVTQSKELDTIDTELLNLDESETDPTKINKGALKRLRRFIDLINDPQSDWHAVVSASKKGVDFFQKIGRSYNKIAPWLGIPSIPEVFIGKKD